MTREALEESWQFWRHVPQITKFGGLVDPGYLSEHYRMLCGMVAHFFLETQSTFSDDYFADRIANVALVFIEDEKANARAIEHDGARCIALNLGLLRQLWALFHMGLSANSFLDDHLDCPVDAAGSGQHDLPATHWQQEPPAEWSESRRELLHGLFSRALDFLVFHELAHHTRGHLDLVQAQFGLAIIDEADNADNDDEDDADQTIRHIEFDADLHAIDMMLISLERERPFESWLKGQSDQQYFLLALAILVVLQAFDLPHAQIDTFYRRSHPAPVHRAMRLVSALSKSFARIFGWDEAQRLREHDHVWYHGAQLALQLGMPKGRWHGSHTKDMGHQRFKIEEAKYLEFAEALDRKNIEKVRWE